MNKKKAANIVPQLILSIFIVLVIVPAQPVAAHDSGWHDDGSVVRLISPEDQVGVGTGTPETKLHVDGTATVNRLHIGNSWGLFTNTGVNPGSILKIGSQSVFGAASPRVTFRPNGNVGIGTSSPEERLHVHGAVRLSNTFGGAWTLGLSANPQSLNFISDPAQGDSGTRVTFRPDGNVGIGTTNPETRLQITGGSDASANGGGYLTMGPVGGKNIVMDNNEIIARDDGGVSTLHLQAEGGLVAIGANVDLGVAGISNSLSVRGNDNNGSRATVRIISGANQTQQTMLLDGNEIDAVNNGLFLNHNSNGNVVLANGGGNVGVGIASPDVRLHVQGQNDGTDLKISDNQFSRISMVSTDPANDVVVFMQARGSGNTQRAEIGTVSNNPLIMFTNGQTRLSLGSDGSVCLGNC